MLFWLCTYDELRLDEGGARDGRSPYATHRNLVIFFCPKLALIGTIYGILVWLYTHWNTKRAEDPTYDGSEDDTLWNGYVYLKFSFTHILVLTFSNFREVTVVALVVVYSFYLFGLLILNADKIRQFSAPFKFIFVLTMITVVFTLVALASGFFFPFLVPALVFVLFYAVINLYLWTIAFSYCPFRESETFKY